MSIPVTVIVPVRNAATTLGAQLEALGAQDHDGEIAVLVADNGSTDESVAVALAHDRPGLRVSVVDASDAAGPAHARNRAIRAATTDLVLGCDADDVVLPNWVRTLTTALAEADVVAGALYDWDGQGTPPPPGGRSYLVGRAGLGYLPGMSGASFGCRRAAWQALGGFDTTLRTGEDLDFAWRAQENGHRFSQCGEAAVAYRVPAEPRAVMKKWFGYGRSQARLYRLHRQHGMPRQAPHRALARFGLLLLTSYRLLGSGEPRQRWCMQTSRRLGRIRGSYDEHVLFL